MSCTVRAERRDWKCGRRSREREYGQNAGRLRKKNLPGSIEMVKEGQGM
ncbi:MAG: hypothetical protein K1W22_12790 [Lachnospiraceae bacterium]